MHNFQERTDLPLLFEAVGCICYSKGRILLLKRTDEKSYPGLWGIPSGKMKEKESRLRAIVRELFEETGILLSADNLDLFRTYHVVTKEMSFLYTVYQCQFESVPEIKIRSEEHTRFAWFEPEEALQLDLVPALDSCLRDVPSRLKGRPVQLQLFPLRISSESRPVTVLEKSVEETMPERSSLKRMEVEKPWYVSFGPTGAGKTTGLKAMSEANENFQFIEDVTILRRRTSKLNLYLHKAFEEGERSLFFHFQMEVLPVRFWQAIKAPAYSLVDETIYSTWAYSRALYKLNWMNKYEYETFYSHYLSYLSMLPAPTEVLYFNCDVDTLMKRIKNRRRRIEKYYSVEYVDALYLAFLEVAGELSDNYKVILIDTDELRVPEIVKRYGPSKPNLLV